MKKRRGRKVTPWLWMACMGTSIEEPNPETALVAVVGLLDNGEVDEAVWHLSAVWEGWETKWYPGARVK